MARCGIAIYGLDPFQGDPLERGLEPALSLRSYVADVKRFALGRGAGKKEEVIAAIARAFPHLGELDEHGSDAVAIGGAGLTAAGWRIERPVIA
jgi:Holliday junction resolvasome RuvABC endonuclease subunit